MRRRSAFGSTLAEKPLHADTLAGLQAEVEAALQLAFYTAELTGREEACELDESGARLLRLLTPLVKLTTGRAAVHVASEVVEAFGGAGYVEDTGLPVLLRDAQVLSIWEGTTNVLSLDVLRALGDGDALRAYSAAVTRRLEALRDPALRDAAARVAEALRRIERHAARAGEDGELQRGGARGFAFALARTYGAALLLEHAEWSARVEDDLRPRVAALRWCAQELAPLASPDASHRADSSSLLES